MPRLTLAIYKQLAAIIPIITCSRTAQYTAGGALREIEVKIMFEKIKRWYPKLWNEQMVCNAVKKGVITAEQFTEITGKEYEGE